MLFCIPSFHLYWPMNDGDTKNYDGVLGSVTMSFAATGLESFDMTVTPVDTSGDTGDMYYELDENDNLLLDGEDALGYELDFDPPLVELTALLVAKGGQREIVQHGDDSRREYFDYPNCFGQELRNGHRAGRHINQLRDG